MDEKERRGREVLMRGLAQGRSGAAGHQESSRRAVSILPFFLGADHVIIRSLREFCRGDVRRHHTAEDRQ